MLRTVILFPGFLGIPGNSIRQLAKLPIAGMLHGFRVQWQAALDEHIPYLPPLPSPRDATLSLLLRDRAT